MLSHETETQNYGRFKATVQRGESSPWFAGTTWEKVASLVTRGTRANQTTNGQENDWRKRNIHGHSEKRTAASSSDSWVIGWFRKAPCDTDRKGDTSLTRGMEQLWYVTVNISVTQSVPRSKHSLNYNNKAMYVEHNSEACSYNHCCNGKAIRITYYECVCSLKYPACDAHAPYCHLWSATQYQFYF
jgi:hypothetical protein